MLLFINLFFIPVISVSIHYRRSNRKIMADFDALTVYVAYLFVIVSVCYVITKIPEVMMGFEISIYSRIYTILAGIIAFILPYAYEIYKKYIDIRCEIKGKNENSKKTD